MLVKELEAAYLLQVPTTTVIPRLHDEAGSTSWLDELASSCKRGIRNHVERQTEQRRHMKEDRLQK